MSYLRASARAHYLVLFFLYLVLIPPIQIRICFLSIGYAQNSVSQRCLFLESNNMNSLTFDEIINDLEAKLPLIFTRRTLQELCGGVFMAKTLANLGQNGPPSVIDQRKVFYKKDKFIEWLRDYWARPSKRINPKPKKKKCRLAQ